ncbi:MAG TPA: hypothetical protein VGQ48_00140 [Gemmatimonadales bacterium]|nr:hypothetical protein [Gemmatimonadales bacterium]
MALASEVKAGLVTAAVTLAVGMLTLNQALVGVFYDDGLYAGLATALSSGLGYVHPNLPGMPGAVHYPPLYPLLLTPLFGVLSVKGAAIAAKVLNAVLNAGAAGLIAWHATKTELLGPQTPRWVSSAVVLAAALAIPVLATQGVLFAEPLFSVLLVIAIVAADSSPLSTMWRGGQGVRFPWIAGAAGALALLTRSIGVAVVAGVVCFLLLRRAPRRVVATAVLPGVAAALAWGLWVAAHARQIDPALALGYGTYFAHLSQAGLSAVAVNVPDMSRPLEALAFGWIPVRWLYGILATVSLGVGLYGLWLVARRSAIGLSLVFYFIILAIWPHPPDRFLWAVLPWLGLVWAAAMLELWRRWPRWRAPVALLAVLVVGGYLHYEIRGFAGRWWDVQARAISANFAELLPVIANLPASAVVATDDEALVWLYTRRQSVPLYLESYRGRDLIRPTPADHRAYLERMGVTHILLASATSPSAIELRALIGAYPAWLSGLYRWSDGRWLFAVNRGQ